MNSINETEMEKTNILIIDDNYDLYNLINEIVFNKEYFKLTHSTSKDIDFTKYFEDSSTMILINDDNLKIELIDIINEIQTNNLNSIPILIFSSNNDDEFKVNIMKNMRYFISKPVNREYCYELLKRISNLASANRHSNTLSGLPSSNQINNELQRRFNSNKPFSAMYIDLDHFKQYNDNYGFLKGNEAILGLSDIIKKTIRTYGDKDDFIGHIGGDDFFIIVNEKNDELIARKIIESFDKLSKTMNKKGDEYIMKINNLSPNKLGTKQIMSVSIALVTKKDTSLESQVKFLENIIRAKKNAKGINGSSLFKTVV